MADGCDLGKIGRGHECDLVKTPGSGEYFLDADPNAHGNVDDDRISFRARHQGFWS